MGGKLKEMCEVNWMKKIVLFGCQQIAVDFMSYLETLKDVELSLVVTYELPMDKLYGYQSVVEACKSRNIDLVSSPKLEPLLHERIEEISPDMIMSVYYRRILPPNIFNIPPRGAFNIHPSFLPFYRGPVPTMWALENGEKEFGVTIHKIDQGIDTGDIAFQEKFPIFDDDTGFLLYTRAMQEGSKMLAKHFNSLLNGQCELKKQRGGGSYYGKYRGKSVIIWRQPAERVRNFIRARAKPFNTAHSALLNSYIFINKATVVNDEKYPAQPPGRILDVLPDKTLIVSCAEGCLRLEEYEVYPPLLDEATESLYLRRGVAFG
jgi:methionyl-tRNA formyltransferase